MASEVGPSGGVVGVDIDDRFFYLTEGSAVELVEQDTRTVEIPAGSLDFIHSRLFFMHLADRDDILEKFVSWLRPGGWTVMADMDFAFDFATEVSSARFGRKRIGDL